MNLAYYLSVTSINEEKNIIIIIYGHKEIKKNMIE